MEEVALATTPKAGRSTKGKTVEQNIANR